MLAVLAAVTALLDWILTAVGAHVSPWLSPVALLALATGLLALHLAGVGAGWRINR